MAKIFQLEGWPVEQVSFFSLRDCDDECCESLQPALSTFMSTY